MRCEFASFLGTAASEAKGATQRVVVSNRSPLRRDPACMRPSRRRPPGSGAQAVGYLAPLLARLFLRRLGEGGANGAASMAWYLSGTPARALRMKWTRQRPGWRRLQAFVRVGDHEPDAAQSAPGQQAQEVGPDGFGIGQAAGQTQHPAAAVGIDAAAGYGRRADNAPAAAALDVGGAEPDEGPVGLQRRSKDSVDALVDRLAQARDVRRGDPAHARREPSPMHGGASIVAAAAEPGDLQLHAPRPGLPCPRAKAVAVVGALRCFARHGRHRTAYPPRCP